VSLEFSFLDSVSAFHLVISTHTSGSAIGNSAPNFMKMAGGPYTALFRIRRKIFVHFIADFWQKNNLQFKCLKPQKV